MIPTSNPSYSSSLKSKLNIDSSIESGIGCYIEYSMNSLIKNISVFSDSDPTKYADEFPINSIAQPFRPENAGIKYTLFSSSDNPKGSTLDKSKYPSSKALSYPDTAPRFYFPGVEARYKYYLTPKSTNLTATVRYRQTSVPVKNAYATGSFVQFETKVDHGFTVGQTVSITGFTSSILNVSSLEIISCPSKNIFRVSKTSAIVKKESPSSAVATLGTPTKYALANKITALFEKSHYLPSACQITINAKNSSGQDESTTYTVNINQTTGKVVLYFDGTSWSSTPLTEPFIFATPKEISSIKISATNVSNKFIGLIELAAKWTKDISSDLITYDVSSESSANTADVLPVGLVTANNISLNLIKYSDVKIQYAPYIAEDPFDSSLTYLAKNVELTPFVKIYGDGYISSPSEGKIYYKVNQGKFYINDYNIGTYGEVMINALDGSKRLIEEIAPNIVCKNFTLTAAIRTLLDSVGFTSYNFNLLKDSNSNIIDGSIPTISYWYTDGSKTVWQCIQELCQDAQINAIFDHSGTLQFYSREFLYKKDRSLDWTFLQDEDGENLPNIVSFDQIEIPSVNSVKVIWQSSIPSNYIGASTSLWSPPQSIISSGGLRYNIAADSSPENTTLILDTNSYGDYSMGETVYNFNGYFLIDSEIIEYDAVQYKCELESPIDGQSILYPWIESQSDINKYLLLSKPGYADSTKVETAYFRPTGRYRVKKRGALGTTPSSHNKSGALDVILEKWSSVSIKWKEK